MQKLDPVMLAVLKGRLEQIADEMDATLFRSAFNPIIAEAHDASHGLYHAKTGETLIQGMKTLGFKPYLRKELQAPIIVTFHQPRIKNFNFAEFYSRLLERGFMIYPGKITKVDSFRIGCIGQIQKFDMKNLVEAVAGVVAEMGVKLK